VIRKNRARAYASLFKVSLVWLIAAFALTPDGPEARNRTRLRARPEPQKSANPAQQIAISISDLSIAALQSDITVTTTQRKGVKQSTIWSGTFYWKRTEGDDRWLRIKFKESGPDILVKGMEIKVYVPKTNRIIETNIQTVMEKYPMYFLDPTEMLGDNYDLKLLPAKNGLTMIKAVPKEPNDTEYAIISVSRLNGNYFPVKFEIVQKTLTRTILLSNVNQPKEIADSLFQLDYPGASVMPVR
jgi:outer membrane lipoprotein-sorting protein